MMYDANMCLEQAILLHSFSLKSDNYFDCYCRFAFKKTASVCHKNQEKPKKVRVDLTGHTYDGRCKRLVDDPINALAFVVLDVCTGL